MGQKLIIPVNCAVPFSPASSLCMFGTAGRLPGRLIVVEKGFSQRLRLKELQGRVSIQEIELAPPSIPSICYAICNIRMDKRPCMSKGLSDFKG